jgi:hypothetical protein
MEMRQTPYDSEALLQRLLADYPNLLAGEHIDPDEPRRLLLITREMPVSGDGGSDRGSLDHLCLDQDAVPTLAEVKRSENTQIRREETAQGEVAIVIDKVFYARSTHDLRHGVELHRRPSAISAITEASWRPALDDFIVSYAVLSTPKLLRPTETKIIEERRPLFNVPRSLA